MGRRRKKFWSYVAGERGRNWVGAFEKEKGGMLFIEWNQADGPGANRRRKRASLGHRDREKAKGEADELAAAFLKEGVADTLRRATRGGVTVHHLIDLYLESETPFKSRSKQGHDRRAGGMFQKFSPGSGPRKASTSATGTGSSGPGGNTASGHPQPFVARGGSTRRAHRCPPSETDRSSTTSGSSGPC